MRTTAHESVFQISVIELKENSRDWMLEGEIQQLTAATLTERRATLVKLFWFFDREKIQSIGTPELRAFFHHLSVGHTTEKGRFDNPRLTKPLRPVSLKGWHIVIAAFFRWMHTEEMIPQNFMARISAPRFSVETKQPLSSEIVLRLLSAAKRSHSPVRNEAIILFLLDTGIRSSELCGLKASDVDMNSRTFKVIGKGNKIRHGYIGRAATRALRAYLRREKRKDGDYLFQNEKGGWHGTGEPLTRSGLQQLLKRLADAANIDETVSPHAFRRTFAVSFLRSGGNVFTAQALLGHSDLKMTRRYCAVAQADIEAQHKIHSPADSLKL